MFTLWAATEDHPQKGTRVCENTVEEIHTSVAAINATGREWGLEPNWTSCKLYGKTMNPNIEEDVAYAHGLNVDVLNTL